MHRQRSGCGISGLVASEGQHRPCGVTRVLPQAVLGVGMLPGAGLAGHWLPRLVGTGYREGLARHPVAIGGPRSKRWPGSWAERAACHCVGHRSRYIFKNAACCVLAAHLLVATLAPHSPRLTSRGFRLRRSFPRTSAVRELCLEACALTGCGVGVPSRPCDSVVT